VTVEQLNTGLLAGAVVLLVAIGAVRLTARSGLPYLLLYVGLGLIVGEDVVGVNFDNATIAQVLGYSALVVILAEGGLTTSWEQIRPSLPAALSLATVGVTVSVLVTATAAFLLLDEPWRFALLVGAVIASTDAAAVFSVLRRVPLPRRLAAILEAESGFNDAPVVILVVALSAAPDETESIWLLVALVAYELALGAVVGLGVGWLGVGALRRIALPASGLYPIAVLAFAVTAYALAAVLHASGFLAVYVAALVLGNSRLPHRLATRAFAEGIGWLAQIGLFVMLGLLADPSELPSVVGPALVIGLVMLALARPLSVAVSVSPFRLAWRHQAFLSWAGLRGAVPIVLATVPVVEGVSGSARLFNLVFVLVVFLTLVQGPTLPMVAQWLGLSTRDEMVDLEVESSPLGRLGADLLEVRVPVGSELQGVEIFELRLPRGAAITLVVRDGNAFVPSPNTPLRQGDQLLVVATAEVRDLVERRLRAVSKKGRLAGWYGERGT
jgi:cell volume regulation protein A